MSAFLTLSRHYSQGAGAAGAVGLPTGLSGQGLTTGALPTPQWEAASAPLPDKAVVTQQGLDQAVKSQQGQDEAR